MVMEKVVVQIEEGEWEWRVVMRMAARNGDGVG